MNGKDIPLDEKEINLPPLLGRMIAGKKSSKKKQNPLLNKNISNKEIDMSFGPYFLTKKRSYVPHQDLLKDTAFEIQKLNEKGPRPKEPANRILNLSTTQQAQLKNTAPLKIVYANVQSNILLAREQISNQVLSSNPPDIIVTHETPLNSSIRFPEYRTFKGIDGKKTINILTARDLGPTLNVFNNKGYPTIRTKDHVISICHSLKDPPQHESIPIPQANTILGDFNLRTFPQNIPTIESYKFHEFEPRGCVGIASTVAFNVTWHPLAGSDHKMAVILLDIKRPPPYSLVNKAYVDEVMEESTLEADNPKADLPQVKLNKRKSHYPVKMSFGYKQLWQFREFSINEKASKFISFQLLDKMIQDQVDILYKGAFKPKFIAVIDEKDEEILRVLIRAFFQVPEKHHFHSKARDFNGFSYNKLVKLMFKNQNTAYWARYFRNMWNRLSYVRTRVISLKKKRVINNIRDVRFIAVTDFLMKIFEEICAPLIHIVRMVTLNYSPSQFGFQTGISCFDLIRAICNSKLPMPPPMNLTALIPDYTLWESSWDQS